MTLNGVVALILIYFTEFDSFAGYYVTVVEDRPILPAEYRLPLLATTDWPTLQRGLSAIDELLVPVWYVVDCKRRLVSSDL